MFLDDMYTYLGMVNPTLGLMTQSYMPATPNKVLTLNEYSASPPEHGFGIPGLRFETPGLQLIARGDPLDAVEPLVRLRRAYSELCKMQAVTINGTKYLFVKPSQSPFRLRIDDFQGGRYEYVVNFLIEREYAV